MLAASRPCRHYVLLLAVRRCCYISLNFRTPSFLSRCARVYTRQPPYRYLVAAAVPRFLLPVVFCLCMLASLPADCHCVLLICHMPTALMDCPVC